MQAQREGQARVEALRTQISRDRTLAEAQLQAVFDDAWWEHATSREVASMWEQAAQWQGQHPEADASATAEQASEGIRREVGERWGVDVTELVALAGLQELDRQYEAAVQEREQLVRVPDNTVPTDRLAAVDERVEALAAERERLAYAAGVTTASADPAHASATHEDRTAARSGGWRAVRHSGTPPAVGRAAP